MFLGPGQEAGRGPWSPSLQDPILLGRIRVVLPGRTLGIPPPREYYFCLAFPESEGPAAVAAGLGENKTGDRNRCFVL